MKYLNRSKYDIYIYNKQKVMVVVSLYLFCYKFYTRVDTFPERDFREKEKKKKNYIQRNLCDVRK